MAIFKRIIVLALCLAVSAGTAAFGSSEGRLPATNVEISIDGVVKPVPEGGAIYIIGNRSYVPLKYFSAAFNRDAGWHQARQLAYIGTVPDWAAADKDPDSELDPLPIRFYLEGVKTKLPEGLTVFVENGMPYVPLRFAAESTGFKVEWVPGVEKNVIRVRAPQ